VTRLLGVVVHNWPLKLAAIGLATLLYGGLVLSQNTLTLPGPIPIDVRNQPPRTFLLSAIPPLSEIRYLSPSGARAISSTFEAWVDLGNVPAGSGTITVPVQVRSIDPRITVLGYEPVVVAVQLEPLETKTVRVRVVPGTPPANLQVGDATADPPQVQVSGPKSVVARVVEARVDVVIQPDGIDVDQMLPAVPVDSLGDAVSPVNVEPPSVHVLIPVFSNRQSRTLPVNPSISGTAAPGFQVTTVAVDPPTVTVEGDADQLATLLRVDTVPIPVTGASSKIERDIEFALPTGVLPLGITTVHVTINVEPVTETRSFNAGLTLVGAKPNLAYTSAFDRVIVTIAGSPSELDRLTASGVTVSVDVAALGPGTAQVPTVLSLPAGLTLVSISPAKVEISVSPATGSAGPSGPAPSSPGP
jgi:YbbR domain-containing protein